MELPPELVSRLVQRMFSFDARKVGRDVGVDLNINCFEGAGDGQVHLKIGLGDAVKEVVCPYDPVPPYERIEMARGEIEPAIQAMLPRDIQFINRDET